MNSGSSALRLFAPILVCCASGLTAQEVDPDQFDDPPGLSISTSSAIAPAPSYTPLDLKQKYFYSLDQMAGPTQWIGFAVNATLDQVQKSPVAWGNNTASFGVRMANHFGRSFVRENIAFGVGALDHEDPRYFRLGQGTNWKRAKYALSRTLMARRDDGGWMPAYSRFVADYATPLLGQTWRPEKFSVVRGVRGGSVALGIDFGSNLVQEFWPDIKKKVWKGLKPAPNSASPVDAKAIDQVR